MRKSKAYVLLSVVIAAAVLGVLVYSVSASEDETIEEETTPTFFWGFRNRWLDTLTDDQLVTLQEMIEENRAEVQNQLDEWGVEFSELDDEQREILKAMIEENHAEVKEQLEAWGIELPVPPGPGGWFDSLTDEQKEELETMRQEYLDSVKAKLEEWGIETPEINGPPPGGMGFRGRGPRGFGLFNP